MSVSIVVNQNAPIVVPWQNGMTAQDALEAAYNQIQNHQQFSFALDYYGSFSSGGNGPLGYLVVMVNGVYDIPNDGLYWAFLVNGAYAAAGIDYTVLNDGDVIAFVNAPYAEGLHGKSPVAAKVRRFQASRGV